MSRTTLGQRLLTWCFCVGAMGLVVRAAHADNEWVRFGWMCGAAAMLVAAMVEFED